MAFFKEGTWPYEITPNSDSYPNVWADQVDLKKLFSEIIFNNNDVLQKQIVTIWGYFGAGKTHKLLFLKNKIEKQNFGICIFSRIPHGTKNFAEIYKSLFFDQIYEQFIHRLKIFAIEHADVDESKLRKIISDEITKKNPTLTLAFTKLVLFLMQKNETSLEVITIQNWLRGEPLNKYTREWIGRKLKEDTDFIDATQSILNLLLRKKLDTDHVEPIYWLIDDCHFLSELKSSKQFNAIQKGFLDIYNMSVKGLSLVFAFAGETEHAVDLSADLIQRRSHKINVHVLTPTQALTYIKELNSDEQFATSDHENKFYPLTEKSAKKLIELFNSEQILLLPRKINMYLHKITRSAENDDLDIINESYIEKKFKQFHKELKEDLESE